MNKLFYSIALLFSFTLSAQIYNPVKWKTEVAKVSDYEYDLIIKSSIETGWHLYATSVPDGGPVATSFSIKKNKDFSTIGNIIEEKGKTIQDPVFKMAIKFFEKSAFYRRIRVFSHSSYYINQY